MRIGISPYGQDRAAVLELAGAAVAGGIDTLWLGDGLFRRPDFAGWRGGLDQLTAGNFVLAVTAGFWADELAYRGIDPARRGAEFRRRLDELLAKLTGDTLSPEPYTPKGPPVWLAGERATLRLAARLGLPFQASRATPAELAPTGRLWKELGGGLLAHRIYAEAGTGVPDGEQVARHVVAGSAAQLAEAFAAYRELGVGDLSVVLGHDDASAMRTLEVLLSDVLPAMPE